MRAETLSSNILVNIWDLVWGLPHSRCLINIHWMNEWIQVLGISYLNSCSNLLSGLFAFILYTLGNTMFVKHRSIHFFKLNCKNLKNHTTTPTPGTKSSRRERVENEPKFKTWECTGLKNWGKCSKSLATKEIEIKTTRMANLKGLKISNVDEDAKQPELSCIASGSIKCYNSGKVSFWCSRTCTYCTSAPKRNENVDPQRDLNKNIHSSFIHNGRKQNTTQISTPRKTNKWTAVYLQDGIPLTINRSKLLIYGGWIS